MRNYKAIFKPLLITSMFVSFILITSPALAKGFNYSDFLYSLANLTKHHLTNHIFMVSLNK